MATDFDHRYVDVEGTPQDMVLGTGNLALPVSQIRKAIDDSAPVSKFELAKGTATAILLDSAVFVDGVSTTFIASGNTNGIEITKVNGKVLYNQGSSNYPKLKSGRAYTIWWDASYNGVGCFFLKASATGTATADKVLAGETFSNENDVDLVGTYKKGMRVKSVQTITCVLTGMEMVKDFNIGNVISGLTAIKASFRTNSMITGLGTAQAYLSGSNIIRVQRGQQLDNTNNVILEVEVIEYESDIKVIQSTGVIYNGQQTYYANITEFSTNNSLIFYQFYSTNNVGLQAIVSCRKNGAVVNGKQQQIVFATGEPISSGAVYISYWLVEYPTT